MPIRQASAEDIGAIMAIERSAHFHPWPEAVIRRYVSKPETVWVLEEQGAVIAWAANTLIAGEAELLMIAVDPQRQGKGAGRQLMNFLQAHLQARHAEQWFLDVRESNDRAVALYESMGFCEAGRRTDYYPTASGHEDALLYCLELSE